MIHWPNHATALEEAECLLRNRLDNKLVAGLDRGAFAENLLGHLRNRKVPHLLFSRDSLSSTAAVALKRDPEGFEYERRIADHAVRWELHGASNPLCERFLPIDRATFNFTRYDHFDPQTIHGLNRHRWFASLARTYWLDRDARYYEALLEHWAFYAEKVPPPDESLMEKVHGLPPTTLAHPYHELDTFIRLTNWWWAYWLILHAREFTPELNLLVLAQCLRLFDLVAARGIRIHEHNFTAMQMEAIFLWATALPEVTGLHVWKHFARNTLEAALGRAVFDDGVQWEKSMGYHFGCIRWYATSYLLAQRNGEAWAEAYGERLRKMGEYVDAMILPDGTAPLISDSDRVNLWRSALSLLHCVFPDMKFGHAFEPTYFSIWCSEGLEWNPGDVVSDKPLSAVFPNAGEMALRTTLGGNASMLIVDNGPNHASHTHKHNLTVHYEAFGKPMVVDPGRWIYDHSDPDRRWVCHVQSHNTVYFEEPLLEPKQLITRRLLATLSTSDDPRIGKLELHDRGDHHEAKTFLKAYMDDPEAKVIRKILFSKSEQDPWLVVADEMQGSCDHNWINSWLFPSEKPATSVSGGWVIGIGSDLQLGLVIASTEKLDVRDDAMFWCPNYAEKSPARWMRFFCRTKLSRRIFVFRPMKRPTELPRVELKPSEASITIEHHTISIPFGVSS